MSALDKKSQLAPAVSQLPVHWYFDSSIFAEEKRLIFDAGPQYIGHQLMVPNSGDYHSLAAHDHAKLLLNNQGTPEILSNICRHRQAVMLEGSGQLTNELIVCPIHRWTYRGQGEQAGQLMGAPHFPLNPCLNLQRSPLQNWQGLLFKPGRDVTEDLRSMRVANEFDFSGYKLDRVERHVCHYNWKTFIEVYLEDYHVDTFHPGLGNFVTCSDLTWQFADYYSVQKVGITQFAKAGSAVYARWQQAVQNYSKMVGTTPTQGAIWLTYYPNIMVEWYPNVLVVSTLIPEAVDKTINWVEFYYPEEIVDFEREFVEAQQAAYLETAIEDDLIGEKMDRGRRQLMLQGSNEVGPYQSPMEDGMLHFHEFYRRLMGFPQGRDA